MKDAVEKITPYVPLKPTSESARKNSERMTVIVSMTAILSKVFRGAQKEYQKICHGGKEIDESQFRKLYQYLERN